ncbi:MAG: threonine synthase [Deltaproteobacteria bacterium]|nr:threonine synthase [Deltaproteobacteria bacterium]
MHPGLIRRYRKQLPVSEEAIVTLLEGNTPLLPAPRLARQLLPGLQVFLKLEGLNPTGSFKDRGMTYAVSKAMEQGAQGIICASTGNTSASAAAFAARAGIKAIVVIPEGKIALGKLSQALVHGAKVFGIRGNFDEALTLVKEVSRERGLVLVNSINPYRLEGQKTAAFEVCDTLGKAPDYHLLPVGNAGNISAYWKGYQEYFEEGIITGKPKMIGFQASGAAPIVRGKIVARPETIATAIRIGNPANWQKALKARDESGGLIDTVTDAEILKAYRMVASLEGYFCEPASAAGIAGFFKLGKKGFFKKGETVVMTLTGHGLKDPDIAIKSSSKVVVIRPDVREILKRLDS